MLIRDRIKTETLTSIEEKIVEYLQNNIEDLQKISTRTIAANTYCSTSAVVRLANRMGYSGYQELREAWIRERDYLAASRTETDFNLPFSKEDSIMQTVSSIESVQKAAVEDTALLLRQEELKKIAECLNASEHILVLGFGAYVPLAQVFQQKMSRIHKHVIVQHHVGEENYQLDLLTKKDCAVLISYSGENEVLIRAARLIQKKRIPIIALTSLGNNTLSGLADWTVRISSREKLFSKIGNFASEESVQFILNVFYSLCFRNDYDKNLSYKIRHAREVEIDHYSTNQMISEKEDQQGEKNEDLQ